MEKEACWGWADTAKQGSATFPKRHASNSVLQARAAGRKPHLLWTQTMKQYVLVRPLTSSLMRAEMASEIYLKCKIYTCPLLLLEKKGFINHSGSFKLQDTVLPIWKLGMAVHANNSRTLGSWGRRMESSRPPWVTQWVVAQSRLHSKLQASLAFRMRPYLKAK